MESMKAPIISIFDQNCFESERPAMFYPFGTFAQTTHAIVCGFDQLFVGEKLFLVENGFYII